MAKSWAKAFWKGVRGKCRSAVARHRRKQRAAARRMAVEQRAQQELQGEVARDMEAVQDMSDGEYGDRPAQEPHGRARAEMDEVEAAVDVDLDETDEGCLMQGRLSWVKLMQDDIDFHKGRGERIGAYITQLQSEVEALEATDLDALQAVQALLAAYANEEADEATPDRADSFARKWKERLRVLLQSARVIEVESQGSGIVEDQAKMMESIYGENTERRLTRARVAQQEDDGALREAMATPSKSTSGSTSVGMNDRPATSSGSTTVAQDVMIKRLVVNGIPVQPGQPVALCGGNMEIAVQMQVVGVQGRPCQSGRSMPSQCVQGSKKGLDLCKEASDHNKDCEKGDSDKKGLGRDAKLDRAAKGVQGKDLQSNAEGEGQGKDDKCATLQQGLEGEKKG